MLLIRNLCIIINYVSKIILIIILKEYFGAIQAAKELFRVFSTIVYITKPAEYFRTSSPETKNETRISMDFSEEGS